VLPIAVILAGAFAAEVSFLFGLPVLTLGSDYFGIATLGFTIVINTLMTNSDTILPFPEMKGGRGMIGIPKITTWFWAFAFLLLIIVVMRNLIYSSQGRAIMSVREDETAAKAMGITWSETVAFVIGSFFADAAGLCPLHRLPQPRLHFSPALTRSSSSCSAGWGHDRSMRHHSAGSSWRIVTRRPQPA
jgi:branched-chain amino acid transport system permease protein